MITRRNVLVAGGAATLASIHLKTAQAIEPEREASMDMDIKRNGSRPSQKGSSEWFTGSVRIDPLVSPSEPARAGAGQVRQETVIQAQPGGAADYGPCDS